MSVLSLGPSLPMSNSAHQMCGQLVSILCCLLANFDQFGLQSCQDSPQETAAIPGRHTLWTSRICYRLN
jgi:hypothetical protein